MFVDSHCHLDFPDFGPELDAVVRRAREAGIGTMLTIGTRHVANTMQLLNAVAALKPGSEAAIGVQRGDQQLQLKVAVVQRPPAQRRPQ